MFYDNFMDENDYIVVMVYDDHIIVFDTNDTSIFIRSRGPLNIKDQAGRSAHKEVGPNK
jgi:hypothetical protein